MLLTKLANKQIANFLRTMTIKNGYFANQLLSTNVLPSFQTGFPDRYNPYYLHLTGQYILQEDVVEELTDDLTGEALLDEDGNVVTRTYGSSIKLERKDGGSKTYRNVQVYSEFDEMIEITSLDTKKPIKFTRENLHGDPDHPGATVHRKTLDAYKVGGRYFSILCERYPKQVDLIKSIVYLVPGKELSADEIANYEGHLPSANDLRMQRVIEAEHLEILQCDTTILEERERESIMSAIKAFLAYYRKRWDIKEFTYEEHYANVSWALMFNALIMVIKMQRLANIRTPHVHSSHVWSDLTSHGLESFKGYLTPDQEFFLYKNIRFLRANAGQHKVLNILVDRLLAENNLHLETKTILQDTTDITKEADIRADNLDEQCLKCSRWGVTCFNRNTVSLCSKIVPRKTLFKPEPVVLSENLYGAREERIITAITTQLGLSRTEAVRKLERSMIWQDSQVEDIKLALDRVQVVDLDGSYESLEDLIDDEAANGLEPVVNEDIIEQQRVALQHVKGTVIPTKLIEITEDHHDPKYIALFQKFFADTLMQFAPVKSGSASVRKMLTNYTIDIDQGAATLNLGFGEAVALLYLNVILANKIHIRVTDPTDPTAEEFITNFLEEDSLAFSIPNTSHPVLTFKLGAPVKQIEVIEAYLSATDADQEKYLSQVTNRDVWTKVCRIRGEFYVITRKERAAGDLMWEEYDFEYVVLGKILHANTDNPRYYADTTNQIAIIPKYFYWHGNKNYVKTVRYKHELDDLDIEFRNGFVAVWDKDARGIYKFNGVTGKWEWLDAESNSYRIVFYRNSKTGEEVVSTNAFNQSRMNGADVHFETFVDDTGKAAEDGEPPIPELLKYEDFAAYYDGTLARSFMKFVLEEYVDIDWILENRYFDTLESISDQNDFGAYLTRMFDMFVRLDVLRNTAGDAKTSRAVAVLFESIIDKRVQSFRLVDVAESSRPTYADWVGTDDDLSSALRHIDRSSSKADLMETLNNDLYAALTSGCNSPYNYNPTSNIKSLKLMQLVKSLSSYLINFINSGSENGIYSEVSHLCMDSCMTNIKFNSTIQRDAVGQADCGPGIPDVNGDFYFLTEDTVAQPGKIYYRFWSAVDPSDITGAAVDGCGYSIIPITEGAAIPYLTHDNPLDRKEETGYVECYEKFNLREFLGRVDTEEVKHDIILARTPENGWLCRVIDSTGYDSGFQPLDNIKPGLSYYICRITSGTKFRTSSVYRTEIAMHPVKAE